MGLCKVHVRFVDLASVLKQNNDLADLAPF